MTTEYTAEEVAKHTSKDDCWFVFSFSLFFFFFSLFFLFFPLTSIFFELPGSSSKVLFTTSPSFWMNIPEVMMFWLKVGVVWKSEREKGRKSEGMSVQ